MLNFQNFARLRLQLLEDLGKADSHWPSAPIYAVKSYKLGMNIIRSDLSSFCHFSTALATVIT